MSNTPKSFRSPEPLSLDAMMAITSGRDINRRALEEEIREPTLTPIPHALATPLERQLASVIGIRGKQSSVPRLPRDVMECSHGGRCCWRWLARAAIEEISGGEKLGHLSLATAVTTLKEELQVLRQQGAEAEANRIAAQESSQEVVDLKAQLVELREQVKDFHVVEKEMVRLQEETARYRATNGKLESQLDSQKREAARSVESLRAQYEAEVTALKERAEAAEVQKMRSECSAEELQKRVLDLERRLEHHHDRPPSPTKARQALFGSSRAKSREKAKSPRKKKGSRSPQRK